tara:strand:+ start:198 stop:518 length:321 start_codon:yes stop_codon:yes gene_type:complete
VSIVTVDNYALDKIIDERIEMAMNIASEYSGCGLFDEDGKLVDTGMYQLTKGTLLEIMQYQQEQITKQREMIDVLVKSIADIDSLETLKKKLSALNINADKGGNNG